MFDTIKIAFPYDKVQSIDITPFNLHPNFIKFKDDCYRVQTDQESRSKIFLPRVEIKVLVTPGGTSYKEMRIEFSIPKLLYGNNISEPSDSDFNEIIDRLYNRLCQMRITVPKETLRTATVVKLHAGKNIDLTNKLTTATVINTLQKIPCPKNITQRDSDYKSTGRGFRWRTNSYHLIAYDKIAELQERNKIVHTTVDGQQVDTDIVSALNQAGIKRILRFEYGLNTKLQIKTAFEACNIDVPLIFQDIFHNDISRKLTTYAWDKLIKPHLISALLIKTKYLTIIDRCAEVGLSSRKALCLYGLRHLMTTGNGLQTMKEKYDDMNYTLPRLEADIQKLDIAPSGVGKTFKYIYESIKQHISIKI